MFRWNAPFRMKLAAGLVALLILLAAVFWFVSPDLDRYLELLNLSPVYVLLITFLVTLPEKGLQNYVLYRALGAPIALGESIALSFVNTLANQLPFAGGLITTGIYLKQRHRLPYTRFLGATVALLILALTSGGVAGLLTLLYLAGAKNETIPGLLILGFVAMSALAALLWLPIPTHLVPEKWRERVTQLRVGAGFLTSNRSLIVPLLLLHFVSLGKFAIRLWAAFHLMSQDVPILYCLLFAAASLLTQLVSIAPGGLGVREAIVAITARLMGLDIGITLIAVGIDRLIATSTNVVLGSLSSLLLGKNFLVATAMGQAEGES